MHKIKIVNKHWNFFSDSCVDERQKLKYEEHIQEFEVVQLIWSLCEIIFIDVAPGMLC